MTDCLHPGDGRLSRNHNIGRLKIKGEKMNNKSLRFPSDCLPVAAFSKEWTTNSSNCFKIKYLNEKQKMKYLNHWPSVMGRIWAGNWSHCKVIHSFRKKRPLIEQNRYASSLMFNYSVLLPFNHLNFGKDSVTVTTVSIWKKAAP